MLQHFFKALAPFVAEAEFIVAIGTTPVFSTGTATFINEAANLPNKALRNPFERLFR